jgi:hypothetical protein
MRGDSPHEIGFLIGAAPGFAWLVYMNISTRYSGGGNWIFMMICGGIGWLAGLALEWLFFHR